MNTETENAIREMISMLDKIQPFTVGRMKEALAGLPDDTQILIGGDEKCSFDWANLSLNYNRPDEESEEYLALTFYIKDDYDGRQF